MQKVKQPPKGKKTRNTIMFNRIYFHLEGIEVSQLLKGSRTRASVAVTWLFKSFMASVTFFEKYEYATFCLSENTCHSLGCCQYLGLFGFGRPLFKSMDGCMPGLVKCLAKTSTHNFTLIAVATGTNMAKGEKNIKKPSLPSI